jgi:hypothetical protein
VCRHVESHIKEDYLDVEKMDENALLMQYFKESCVTELTNFSSRKAFLI